MKILTDDDVSAGLPAPAAAAALLGKGGAAAMLVLLFLAVTSATSAELIAVSSILTYDVYKRYINPQATEKQILWVSHMMIVAYAIFMGIAGTIFFYIGISMGWLYLFMGTVLGSAVVPVALSITWKHANATGCVAGAAGGFVAGLIAWLVTTDQLYDGVINATTTGENYPMLAGNVASIVIGGLIAIVWSLVNPDMEFSWERTRAINSVASHVHHPRKDASITPEDVDEKTRGSDVDEKTQDVTELTRGVEEDGELKGLTTDEDLDRAALKKAFLFAVWSSVALFVIMIILVPLPLFFSQVVYGTKGFTAWTVIGIIWMFFAVFAVVIYPVYESRTALAMVTKGIIKSVASSTPKLTSAEAITAAESRLGAKYNNWPTKLEYVFTDNNAAVLTYVVQIQNTKHWFEAFVDAHTGDVVNVVDFVAKAAYRVVPFTKQDPTWDGFSLIKDPADLSASPDGWHQDTDKYNSTRGNNVNVISEAAGLTYQSGPNLVFDYQWNSTADPTTDVNAKVGTTNAFYVANSFHDLLYKYGFTEAAYNFQNVNFGKVGAGGDAVNLEIQVIEGTDNAWFATPPDGQPGASEMYLWDLSDPRRDGALGNDIITHEFTHGLTNRMTGGGTGECLASLEAGGMGEGWSDTMSFWVEANSTTPVDYAIATWAYNNPAGIRSVPYSVNMTVDPYTYSTVGSLYEVHDIGEVWATMLIETYWALVAAKGYSPNKTDPTGTAGNIAFLHLFVDALPIQPCNPTFTDARDAIIQADVNRYAGENRCTLWKAFAKRGLGVKAANYKDDFTVPSGC
ncbi:hypothetical protein FRB99_006461 [Tulasnella sp. 403]|nr:hypothetical protein FRB99_006461 [Tulasnella sp. 403]